MSSAAIIVVCVLGAAILVAVGALIIHANAAARTAAMTAAKAAGALDTSELRASHAEAILRAKAQSDKAAAESLHAVLDDVADITPPDPKRKG